MKNPQRYLVTSALPYANGPLHIGHLAGAYLSADVYVRFLRMMGHDVVWVCGSDEHGAAITFRAIKENSTPKEVIDKYHDLFVQSFEKMHISFDIYHRTSSDLHHKTSRDFFLTLYNNQVFEENTTEQYFDEVVGQFLADRYIVGQCPNCSYANAYGDQCENCGTSLSPKELIKPKSKLSDSKPVLKQTKHWYLPLQNYSDWLEKWIETGKLDDEQLHDPSLWKNHVIGQCKSWIDSGLASRSMTRDLNWGVDVPESIEGHEGKKLYVWLDAPIGYISATKQWALDNDRDWEPYWKDEDTALIHFIGKDNIVFHCIIFPALLKAHGGYILPKNVPANQFVNLEGNKISTSKNWAVWVNEYTEKYPNKIDELRYHMIKIMPELKDSEFSWLGYQESINNELVNNFGNFVNRVFVLTHKYFDGEVPEFNPDQNFESPHEDDLAGFHDCELIILHDDLQEINDHLRSFEFRAGLKKLMEISQKANQLLQMNEPWKNFEENKETVKCVMNLSLQICAAISVFIRPFLPVTSDKLRKQLNLSTDIDRNEMLEVLNNLCEGFLLIPSGHAINPAQLLFDKIDDEMVENEKAALMNNSNVESKEVKQNGHVKNTIQFEDFQKLDLRIGTITHAEKVKKTDKLLKLTVDLGFENRTIVSGIAQQFDSADLSGKQVMIVANLAPRKMRGIESQGMILLAEDADGKLNFVNPESKITNGVEVK